MENVLVHALVDGKAAGEPLYSGNLEGAAAFVKANGGVIVTPADSEAIVDQIRAAEAAQDQDPQDQPDPPGP